VPDGNGRSDFERLRRRNLLQRRPLIHHAAATEPAVLACFDVLFADGQDARSWPLRNRLQWLERHLCGRRGLQVIQSIETHGAALFPVACEQDLEGIVGKQATVPYKTGRQDCWLKIKNKGYSRQDAVVWRER
jgi:bifunctional non-homologous end joining protein LigD